MNDPCAVRMARLLTLFLVAAMLLVSPRDQALGAAPGVPEMPRPSSCPDVKGAVACSIRFAEYRPLDPRVARLEREGLSALRSGGRTLRVESAAKLNQLRGQLRPGDQLVLSGTEWRDAELYIEGEGTMDRPIVVSAESAQGLRLTGGSTLRVRGKHIVVAGLRFVDGKVPERGGSIIALGSPEKPCDQCILWSSEVHNVNTDPSNYAKVKSVYVSVSGRDATVADSSFSGQQNRGHMLANYPRPGDLAPRLHVYRNRFSARPPGVDGGNGYEIIQFGGGASEFSAYSVIEGNVFEDCDGEGEIVTLKYADVLVLGNRFLRSQGTLSLRQTDRVFVGGIRFEGGGKPSSGGVRVIGSGHVVANNEFVGLKQPINGHYAPISILGGDQVANVNGAPGYAQVRDAIIAGNKFIENEYGILVGGVAAQKLPLLPEGVIITGNVALQKSDHPFFLFDARMPLKDAAKGVMVRNNTLCTSDAGLASDEWRRANRLHSPNACPVALGQ